MDEHRRKVILTAIKERIINSGEHVPVADLVTLRIQGGQLDDAAAAILNYFSQLSPL